MKLIHLFLHPIHRIRNEALGDEMAFPKIRILIVNLLFGICLLQSCFSGNSEPKTRVEISLLEEVDDFSEITSWLQDYVKATIGKKPEVKIYPDNKTLAIVIPAKNFQTMQEALEAKAGVSPKILTFHAVKKTRPEVLKKVIDGEMTIPGHIAMRYKDDPDRYLIAKTIPVLDSSDIESASPLLVPSGWSISVTFTKAGAARMGAFTKVNARKPIAIVMSGKVLSAPIIQEPFESGCRISGTFTKDEAFVLAEKCRTLPPIKFKVLTKTSPSTAAENGN